MFQQAFKFGAFAFDAEKPKLTRNGELIVIGQRAAAILTRLLQANGGVVSKDDLFAAADWTSSSKDALVSNKGGQ